jgi:HAD superfamily (subfamily IIIA) phosphatase, TIGR01668
LGLIASGSLDFIAQLPLEALRAQGKTLLLADLDNTLAAYGQAEPDEALMVWKAALEAAGLRLFVLSNSRSKTRAAIFCTALGVPFIAHAGKPRVASFHRALEQMGATAAETVMLGDQIFTDIWGANRAGIESILFKPIRLAGNPGRYVRYAVELPLRAMTKRWK